MLTEIQRTQIAAEAKLSVNTVRRWEIGTRVTTEANKHAIRAAIAKLRIKLEPDHPRATEVR